ncbi:hypothetical protein EVAR_27042_1 [Eumeta japonica]|uniref:Uncharacterized protein n=1 Tax=Eumeta variegata TaxID=151549 RepID=A0A4C1WEQ0_EUMVA|nr:hypothetical protein EVAR_27042_1 [Eumeta japonica]
MGIKFTPLHNSVFKRSENLQLPSIAQPQPIRSQVQTGDSQDDSADNEEDSDVCRNEVDSSDDSESSLESDYE